VLASTTATIDNAVITKADFEGTKQITKKVVYNKARENYTIDLTSLLPDGYELSDAIYETNTDDIFDTTTKTTPVIENGAIIVDIASVEIGKTGVIEVTVNSTNYKEYTFEITVNSVDKETVEITGLTILDKEYNGDPITYTGELSVSGDKVLVSDLIWLYTGTDDTEYSSGDAPVNAGTYKLTVSVPDSNDEYMGSVEYPFEITPKTLTLSYDQSSSKTKEYDGTKDAPQDAKLVLSRLAKETDDVRVVATFTYDDENAGTGKTIIASDIILEGTAKDNYEVSTTFDITGASITPKPVTLKSATVANRNYIAGDRTVEVTAIEFNEDTPIPLFENNEVTAEAKMDDENAGTGKNVTVSITYIDENYSISANAREITTTVDIAKIDYDLEMTGTVSPRSNREKTGNEYNLANVLNLPEGYTFGTPTITDNEDGVLTGTPSVANNVLTYDVASVVAGKTATIEIPVSSTNYNDKNAVITFTVVDKEEVEIDGLEFENKVYDGTAITSTGELTVSEPSILVSDLEWLYTGTNNTTYNSAEAPVNVGTYKVTFPVPDSNEDYIGSFTDTFEITAKEITAVFDETSSKTKVYDGTEAGPEGAKVKLIGIVDNEVSATATFTYDNANAETGKTLTATNITLEGNTKDNYTLSTTTLSIADAIITPKPVTLKSASVENRDYIAGDSAVYVTAIEFNGAAPVPSFEDNEVTAEANMDDENAGEGKNVTVTINYIDTNYSLSENTITTTVDIAKIAYNKEITGSTSVRGEVAKTGVEYDLTGLLNLPEGYTFGTPTYIDNTDGVLTGTPSVANNVLTYDVTSATVGKTGKVQIPVSSTNYTDVNAILTITTVEKEPLTISGLTYANKEYDGTVVTPTGTLAVTENKVLVEELVVEYFVFDEEQNEWQLIDELLSTVGQYKVRYSISYSNENYTGEQEYTFDITKKTPTITLSNLTQTVGSVTNVTYTVTPAVTDGTTKVEYKLSTSGDTDYAETLPTEIGTYTVRVSVSGDTNLNDTEKTETFTIKKKQSTGGGGGGGSTTTKYEIKVTQNDGGTISPETLKVEKGENQTFEIKANEGYEIEDVLVDNVSVGKVSSYTFEKVKEKHTIEATFKLVEEVTEETWKNPFVDVAKDDWYYESVKYANENKLFNGVSNTEFGANIPMTRGMLVTVLYRLEGEPATNRSIPFADVDMSMYYANAVIWAKQHGIVNGVDATNFVPNGEITREQLVTILYRYAQYKGKDVSVGENTNILSYDDFNELSEYAIPAMQWACGSGIITGRTTSTIAPKGTATRAEVATMLMRYTKE